MRLISIRKTYSLLVTQEELLEEINQASKPRIWRLGMREFYIVNEDNNQIVVSDKGQLETKFILMLDEQNNKINIQTRTLHNLYFFIPFSILFFLILSSIDDHPLTVSEGIILIVILTITVFLLNRLFSYFQFQRFVGKLKDRNLIEQLK
ncbi:MAG: hypothetical protein DWQ02_09590 [Bacteroidetes bacterium]|nr:MAG: hypothetical protein DWQ02_09590 [Bacteroidota bacterium]